MHTATEPAYDLLFFIGGTAIATGALGLIVKYIEDKKEAKTKSSQ